MNTQNTETQATEPRSPAPEETARPTEAQPDGPDIEPERLDPDAVRVVARLRQHNHEAYLVGGCVRDLLLGR